MPKTIPQYLMLFIRKPYTCFGDVCNYMDVSLTHNLACMGIGMGMGMGMGMGIVCILEQLYGRVAYSQPRL
jgi:hypothetical protein